MYTDTEFLSITEKAIRYGLALDTNDLDQIVSMLSPDIAYYNFDNGTQRGAHEVCNFIKSQRDELRQQVSQCKWEQSYVTKVSDYIVLIHFHCELANGSSSFRHHCSQRLYFNDQGKINMIDFIDEPAEQRSLVHFLDQGQQLRLRA